jgi:GR25 family glycosyltransferase involved in LPS biosynthesis
MECNELCMILLIIILIILLLNIFSSNCKNTEPFNNINNINNKIDANIYINLENRTDRKELLLKEFQKMNLTNIYRIAAVPIPKNGHKGCCQSHILALELAKLNNWDTVAIFEDDFELNVSPEEYNRLVNKALNYPKWDVIVLHGSNQKKKKDIEVAGDIYYLKHSTQSTAYIIKKEYIDTLLELFRNCNSNMSPDHWGDGTIKWESYALDQQWNKLIEKDNWIGFKTNLGKQRDIASSIMNDINN